MSTYVCNVHVYISITAIWNGSRLISPSLRIRTKDIDPKVMQINDERRTYCICAQFNTKNKKQTKSYQHLFQWIRIICQLLNYRFVDGIVGVTNSYRLFSFLSVLLWTKFQQTSGIHLLLTTICCMDFYGHYYRPLS